ncbi:hypothetical protein KTO58_01610 [Chitinophaga pendula]|uniref:hypothetical protein n=1 Tax=Chitinophaga TaxID=79328 RepID=UPI000BAFD8D7|nr:MULTISPECIES: hypothetical protein [Chitinophaga]ASZ14444.1 hypothetical protein CK934_27610 [Chitinophaga sp. MD30]UCJ07901.1 hypothetical protein KTO58_01610 [Chitinophaga pendula]
MDKKEKAQLMDKILRELEDLKNTQSSLVKKIGQIETDNINLGDNELEKSLSDIYDSITGATDKVDDLLSSYQQKRDKYVADNNLAESLAVE